MTHLSKQLHNEFPHDQATLRKLKSENPHFERLNRAHSEIDARIYHAEIGVEPLSQVLLEDLKKQRLALLDEISALVRSSRQTVD